MQGHPILQEPRLLETMGKNPWQQSIKCWSCGGDHMLKDFSKRGYKVRTMHNVQQAAKIEDMGINMPRIYIA